MIKIYKLALSALACLATNVLQSQTVVIIPTGNTAATVTNTTVHRKPLGENRAFERTALKYTYNEIGMMGTITNVAFYCDTINNPGKTAVKIYLKEVPDSTFTASTVAAEETGATLVYSDTIYPGSFTKGSWTNVTLTTPFLHATSKNMEVIVETNNNGFTAGTDLTVLSKGFRGSAVVGSRMQYWQSPNGSGTAPAGNGTLVNAIRSNIQLTITPLSACTAPPTAGTTMGPASICSGSVATLTLSGSSIGTGLTYQWISSPNGTTWSTIPGATSAAYTATVSAVTYYACVLTCSAQNDTSTHLQININPFYNCYCTAGIGGNCANSTIDSVAIAGTTLANGPTGCSAGNYTSYPASGNTTATLSQGQSYVFNTKYITNSKGSVWIDYNQNGIFETTEWKQLCLTSVNGTMVSTNVTIPPTALLGMTGMRFRSRGSAGQNDSSSACANFLSGETEDYIVNIIAGSACTAPPTAGTTVATPTNVCSGGTVNLSLSGNSTGLGQTYQWQSSPDGLTWTPIGGATSTAYSVAVSAVTYYSCVVTCSGQSATSSTVQININPFYNCYCTTGIGGGCTAASAIDSVAITGTTLSNGPLACPPGNYIAYPASGNTTASLTQGVTYSLDTRFGGSVIASVWIDYNQDGIFGTNEWKQICTTSTAGTDVLTNLTIPFSALPGVTGMRIRSRGGSVNDSTSSCTAFGSGETQDYIITIVAGSACTAPPTAGTTVASPTVICAGGTVNLSLNGNSTGSGQTYQWQSSPDGTTWTPIGGATLATTTETVSATTYYSCIITCSGQSATSATVQVSLNPFYNCYCVSGIGGGCAQTSIDSVAIVTTTLDNGPTGCSVGNYTAYPALGNTTASLINGMTYTISTVFTGTTTANCSMWIDYNQNGIFDADSIEWTQVCTTSTALTQVNATFTVPVSALTGLTGMRVRSRSSAGANDSSSACAVFGTGETEDYLVTIVSGSTGIKNTQTTQMYVFPNPTNGIVNIGLSLANASKVNYQITNIAGQTIYNEQTEMHNGTFSKSFDLSGFTKGVYFIKVITDKEIVMKKVILQ